MAVSPSPRLGKREARRLARTEEILEAALALVQEGGFANLTMPKLAKRVNAAVGALYRYFESKHELLAVLQIRAFMVFNQMISSRIESAYLRQTPPYDNLGLLREMLLAWPEFADRDPARFALIDATLSNPDQLWEEALDVRVMEAVQPLFQRFVSVHQKAAEAGALTDGDPLARAWIGFGCVRGLTHFRVRDNRQPANLRSYSLIEDAVDSLLIGWGATHEQVAGLKM